MFGKRLSIGTGLRHRPGRLGRRDRRGRGDRGQRRAAGLAEGHSTPAARRSTRNTDSASRASAALSASGVSSVPQPDWLRALQLRSEAMNHRYGLSREPGGAVTHVSRIATASNTRAGLSHTGPGHRRRHAAGAVTNVRCYATARNSLSGLGLGLCARLSPS